MDHTLTDFFNSLDTLYAQGKTQEIEPFLRHTLEEHRVCCGGHDQIFTAALNELGTYYRGASRYDEALRAFESAGQDILSYGTKDTMDYATNRLNLAGTLRLMKQYQQALPLYMEAADIYSRISGRRSYHYAAALNNLSLIYLDLGQYRQALDYAQQALQIIGILPGHPEERAISLINRSTASWYLGDAEKAREGAEKALALYESLPEKGVHYAAALNLCGTIDMDQKRYERAWKRFIQAAEYTKGIFGENDEYRQAMANAALAREHLSAPSAAEQDHIYSLPRTETAPASPAAQTTAKMPDSPKEKTGLTLCRAYYEEIGRPMIERDFADVQNRIAVGLVGDGSECYGFDDAISRDHDWGPSFCLWLTNEDYAKFGQALQQAYDALPKTFRGYTRNVAPGGEGRVGVLRISDFYRQFTGLSHAPESIDQWNRLDETYLAKATNGEVFADPLGRFTSIRNALLSYYPEDVRLKKIALRAAVIAQSGQYNYARCLKRKEMVGANCALYEFIRAAMSMAYLLNKRYMPFYKWAHHGLQYLPALSILHEKIQHLSTCADTDTKEALIEDICSDIRQEWRRQHIADGSDNFLITYGPQIISHIQNAQLRSLPIMQAY